MGDSCGSNGFGWAGVELESQGERVVIDPLQDAGAVFAWLGERAAAIQIPVVVPAQPGAIAGLLTHLHRDHARALTITQTARWDEPITLRLDVSEWLAHSGTRYR